jgi:hypothetical protein
MQERKEVGCMCGWRLTAHKVAWGDQKLLYSCTSIDTTQSWFGGWCVTNFSCILKLTIHVFITSCTLAVVYLIFISRDLHLVINILLWLSCIWKLKINFLNNYCARKIYEFNHTHLQCPTRLHLQTLPLFPLSYMSFLLFLVWNY